MTYSFVGDLCSDEDNIDCSLPVQNFRRLLLFWAPVLSAFRLQKLDDSPSLSDMSCNCSLLDFKVVAPLTPM